MCMPPHLAVACGSREAWKIPVLLFGAESPRELLDELLDDSHAGPHMAVSYQVLHRAAEIHLNAARSVGDTVKSALVTYATALE
jgi:hypothetical protein